MLIAAELHHSLLKEQEFCLGLDRYESYTTAERPKPDWRQLGRNAASGSLINQRGRRERRRLKDGERNMWVSSVSLHVADARRCPNGIPCCTNTRVSDRIEEELNRVFHPSLNVYEEPDPGARQDFDVSRADKVITRAPVATKLSIPTG